MISLVDFNDKLILFIKIFLLIIVSRVV